MEKPLSGTFKKRLAFFSQNPQILYTAFLLIVIPVAFLVSGRSFLDVATMNQERLEKDRIGLMQDVFVEFAEPFVADPAFLQERVEDIAGQNETITGFKVVVPESEGYRIVASMDTGEIGTIDTLDERRLLYRLASVEDSIILPGYEGGVRHWKAVRSVGDITGTTAIIFTDVSMEHIDTLLESRVRSAYFLLVVIIVVIGVLLLRQAKVIDYAVLYKRLKEVDQMKDDFVSMAAHELRTPLTIIRGYTEMLGESKRLTESDRQLTQNIENSANHLNQLIGDILDVSRLQQGRLSFNLTDVDPTEHIAAVVESLRYTANQKGLQIAYESKGPALIAVDVDRLKQILINLIGNAVKYTLKGSVTVTSRVENDQCVIRISDTGIGISAEEQKKLFTRFYRVKTKETEDIRGTGLGLWITKEIVTQMKGSVSVESIQGKGTDLIVMFPVKKIGV